MALGSIIYNFNITVSDTSRGLYQTLPIQVARHSSETLEHLLARVLAYCLEYDEQLTFSKGLDDPEAPALWAHDLTGQLTHWIEVGAPAAKKLHKASKQVTRVSVYTTKHPSSLIEQWKEARVHRAEKIVVHSFAPTFLAEAGRLIERRNNLELTASEGELYLNILSQSFSATLSTQTLG